MCSQENKNIIATLNAMFAGEVVELQGMHYGINVHGDLYYLGTSTGDRHVSGMSANEFLRQLRSDQ